MGRAAGPARIAAGRAPLASAHTQSDAHARAHATSQDNCYHDHHDHHHHYHRHHRGGGGGGAAGGGGGGLFVVGEVALVSVFAVLAVVAVGVARSHKRQADASHAPSAG